MTPYDLYQFILNASGIASGWISAYYLLFVKQNYPDISIPDLSLILVALLGIFGFTPKVLSSFDLGMIFKGSDSRPREESKNSKPVND